ncbi:hypothetical protein WG907_05180 [Sphingobium sp. AN558]|uniref:hypothetical protein n=1 Tax=Sphingobium sp. AN558 TaxID=3133442 RepID=UPI0030C4601B
MAQINYSDDADYSDAREGFILNSPVLPSLIHFFDQGAVEGARNLASIDAAGSAIVGAPIDQVGFVRFGSQNQASPSKFVQTEIADAASVTFLVIAKSPDSFADGDHKPSLIGNFATGDAHQGISLVMDNDGGSFAYAEFQNGGAAQLLTITAGSQDNSEWTAFALVVDAGIGMRLYNYTEANADSGVNTALPRRLASRPLWIGAVPAGFAGLADIAFVAIIPAALTRVQGETAFAPVRAYLAEKFGITA